MTFNYYKTKIKFRKSDRQTDIDKYRKAEKLSKRYLTTKGSSSKV